MSPILVRPVREQLEHDRVIRLLQVKLKRKHDVVDEHRRGSDGSGAHRPGADFPGPGADLGRSRQEADGNGRGRDRRVGQPSRGHGPMGPPRPGPRAVSSLRSGRAASTSPAAWRRRTASTSPKSGATTPSATRPGSRSCTGRRPPSRDGCGDPRAAPKRSRAPPTRPRQVGGSRRRPRGRPRPKRPRKTAGAKRGTRAKTASTRRKRGSKPCPPSVHPRQTRLREHVRRPHAAPPRQGRPRILYWFRTPPGVRVGRAALDEDAIRLIEEHHPDIQFDWPQILNGEEEPAPPAAGRGREREAPRPLPRASAMPESRRRRRGSVVLRRAMPRRRRPSPLSAAHARLGSEALARLRAPLCRRAREHLTRRVADEQRREQLREQAERLNPDNWVTDDEVTAGLEAYEIGARVAARRGRPAPPAEAARAPGARGRARSDGDPGSGPDAAARDRTTGRGRVAGPTATGEADEPGVGRPRDRRLQSAL